MSGEKEIDLNDCYNGHDFLHVEDISGITDFLEW